MNMRIFDRRFMRQGLTILLIFGALSCMFPPAYPLMAQWAGSVVWIAVGYVGLGLFFLIFKKTRLMFVCFGCGAAISLFQLEIAKIKMHGLGQQRVNWEQQRLLTDSAENNLSIPAEKMPANGLDGQ